MNEDFELKLTKLENDVDTLELMMRTEMIWVLWSNYHIKAQRLQSHCEKVRADIHRILSNWWPRSTLQSFKLESVINRAWIYISKYDLLIQKWVDLKWDLMSIDPNTIEKLKR